MNFKVWNDLILKYGIQKAPELLRQALVVLGKKTGYGNEKFPQELEFMWDDLERLTIDQVESLDTYVRNASSLVYRYVRKIRIAKRT